METTDYNFNYDFYSEDNVDQVTNCSSNTASKQGFMREIMARPMTRFLNLDKTEDQEQNSDNGSAISESVRKKMIFG